MRRAATTTAATTTTTTIMTTASTTLSYLLVSLLAIAVFVALFILGTSEAVPIRDVALAGALYQRVSVRHARSLRVLARLLSASCDGSVWFTVPLALAAYRHSAQALSVVLSCCLPAAALELAAKAAVRRGRPQHNTRSRFFAPAEKYSFPSGHATRAFALATYALARVGASSACGSAAVVLWAAGVAASRVAIGRHYPTDVIAGMLLGAFATYAADVLLDADALIVARLAPLLCRRGGR